MLLTDIRSRDRSFTEPFSCTFKDFFSNMYRWSLNIFNGVHVGRKKMLNII